MFVQKIREWMQKNWGGGLYVEAFYHNIEYLVHHNKCAFSFSLSPDNENTMLPDISEYNRLQRMSSINAFEMVKEQYEEIERLESVILSHRFETLIFHHCGFHLMVFSFKLFVLFSSLLSPFPFRYT